MAYEFNTGATSIEFGTNLRVGYRINGSSGVFTYFTFLPEYNDLPYVFSLPGPGVWEIEYSQTCPSCSGTKYSDPETAIVTIP